MRQFFHQCVVVFVLAVLALTGSQYVFGQQPSNPDEIVVVNDDLLARDVVPENQGLFGQVESWRKATLEQKQARQEFLRRVRTDALRSVDEAMNERIDAIIDEGDGSLYTDLSERVNTNSTTAAVELFFLGIMISALASPLLFYLIILVLGLAFASWLYNAIF